MPNFLWIVFYILGAAVVVFLSIKLSDYVDLLDKKTKVSGAFLGGILLAAVTSLPELFTSISATVIASIQGTNANQMVLGNILGSDLFNICLFAIIFIAFFSKMVKSKVNKSSLITMFFTAVMYAIVAIASFVFDFNGILFGWFNPMSIAIVAVYALSVLKTPKEEEAENKETDSKLTVKQIVLLFVLFSVLLVGASVGLTIIVDNLVSSYGFGATFGGALFLGVATSIPELTATINLCKKGNLNAACGDIVGSNVFNCLILVISDLLSFGCASRVYTPNQSSFLLLVCGAVSIATIIIALLLKTKDKVKNVLSHRILYIVFSILVIGSYITFLVLSNIDLHIPFAPIN